MSSVRVIEIKKSVFAENDRRASELRAELQAHKTFLLNLMSSPGSGKTTLLLRTIEALKDEFSLAVMEADIDSDVDACAIDAVGVRTIQLHTGGMCHLDAYMCEQGLRELLGADMDEQGKDHTDLVFLENVGNLVCPAEFDTGASANAMILSVPEGDDKALKYPLMFEVCELVLINKIDTLSVFDTFSIERATNNIHYRNPKARVIPVSAKTGEGIDEWTSWLRDRVKKQKAGMCEG